MFCLLLAKICSNGMMFLDSFVRSGQKLRHSLGLFGQLLDVLQVLATVSGVEEEISSSPPVFNVSQALTGSSVDCSWNGSSHHDSVSTAQLYSPQSHHSIGKEVDIVLRIYYD